MIEQLSDETPFVCCVNGFNFLEVGMAKVPITHWVYYRVTVFMDRVYFKKQHWPTIK